MWLINKIPIRIHILILIFVIRFLTMCTNYHLRYSFNYMILRKDTVRYKPWCYLTPKERTENMQLKIPWYNISTPDYGPRYNFPSEARYWFRDAVFFGQMVACVPGGIMAEYVGPYYVLLYSTAAIAILHQLRLIFAEMSLRTLLISEFFVGCHIAIIYSACLAWIARWAPPNERGIFAATIMADGLGTSLEAVFLRLTMPTLGWRGTFYVLTSAILLYLPVLFFLGSNYPEDHKRISTKEVYYIKTSQRGRVTSTKSFPPLGKIMISKAYWAVNILNFGTASSIYYFTRAMFYFLYDFMGIGKQFVEFIEVFPSIGFSGLATVSGLLADFLRTKNIGDEIVVVRLFAVCSHLIPGCIIIFMGLAYCDQTQAIVMMFVGYACSAAYIVSIYRTIVDITPNYAGTMYGLCLLFSSFVSIIIPRMRYEIVFPIDSGIIGWSIMFLLGGGCTIGTGIIFMFFGTNEGERWNLKSQDEMKLFYYKKPEEPEEASGRPSTSALRS